MSANPSRLRMNVTMGRGSSPAYADLYAVFR
jgi:hypothetical protein